MVSRSGLNKKNAHYLKKNSQSINKHKEPHLFNFAKKALQSQIIFIKEFL